MPARHSCSRTMLAASRAAACAVAVAVLLLIGGAAVARAASPGSLSSGFGSGGFASTGAGTRLLATAVQSDGKVLAVGQTSGSDLLVARFTASGSPDDSFGNHGVAQGPDTGAPFAGSIGRAVAVQPDGKIVVVGSSGKVGGGGVLVERFNANGSADGSFGHGGAVNLLTGSADGYSIAIQPDGKILAGGAANSLGQSGLQPRVVVVRLTSSGNLDTSFAGNGTDIIDLGPESAARALALQRDGKIILAGDTAPGLQVPLALVGRLTSSGQLDHSFNGSGSYMHQFSPAGANSAFYSVAVQPDGKIVAGGATVAGAQGANALVARFTTSGALDGSFASGGFRLEESAVNSPAGTDGIPGINGIAVAPNGDVIAVGYRVSGAYSTPTAWAFTSQGNPDTRFGSGGVAAAPFASNRFGRFDGLAITPNGDIAAVGGSEQAYQGAYTGVVAQFAGFGSPPPPPPGSPSRIALMGRMGFVSPGRVIGVEVGCFGGTTGCSGQIKMTVGNSIIGQRNFKLDADTGGFQNLKLSARGAQLLRHNRVFHLLAVNVTITGSNGQKFTHVMSLARWVWGNGSGNAHDPGGQLPSSLPAKAGTSRIGLMGRMGFVSPGSVIGVEVGCFGGLTGCSGQITMTHAGKLVGQRSFRTGPESGGFQNLKLTSEGRKLLAENRPWRLLGVDVVVTGSNGQRISEAMDLASWVWR